ncbi:phage holin family protein [Pseudonocardia sp. Cha107L01]|uniref:phage holin family protein n=1 Tax=Pseudonocardia sp. Cha107L01 TaxID=3457576 RepID=UPI00403E925A
MANPTPGGRGTEVPTPLRSIPLSAEPSVNGDASIGGLVREASSHVSTLLRAELELAKQEVTAEVKKGVQGSVFFLVALTIVLFSLFFFFIAVAELLTIWLMPWAAYLVVFGIMLVVAGLAGLIGFLRVRKIHAPERTISTVKDTAAALGRRGGRDSAPALER